jgi:hypothetical protein
LQTDLANIQKKKDEEKVRDNGYYFKEKGKEKKLDVLSCLLPFAIVKGD